MQHAIAAMEVAEAFEQARLVLENLRTYSPLACAMDLIKDNLMFRTWLTLTDVLEEPEQAILKRDALAILTENDLTTYLEHVPTMLLEW
jgi:hypothetical protein